MTQETQQTKYVESVPKLKRVKCDLAKHQARKKIEQWKEKREFEKQFEL